MPFSLEVTGLKISPPPSYHGLAELQESAAQSPTGPTEIQTRTMPSSAAELQQSPTPVTSTQLQHSSHQLSYALSSPTPDSIDDQLVATEQSPVQDSSMPCSVAHSSHSSPPNSPIQIGLIPSQAQLGHTEPQHTPPSHSPAQNITTLHGRLCSPTDDIIPHPQHSPSQMGQHSPMPHSHTQVCTQHLQSSTQDVESTLDQENLRCGFAQGISTLDQDLSQLYCMSNQKPRRRPSKRPVSAPCSPSSPPLRPTQYSLSQPASPVPAHSTQPLRPLHLNLIPPWLDTHSTVTAECTKTGTTEMKYLEDSPVQPVPNLDGKTLESSPHPCNSTSELSTVSPENQLPNQSSPLHVPDITTPESLVHISTSAEHSSLTCSPCGDEMEEKSPPASHIHQCLSSESPTSCSEGNESKNMHIQASSASISPTYASEMPRSPASSLQACASPVQMEASATHDSTIAADISPSLQPASPVTVTVSSSTQSVTTLASPATSSIQPASPSAVLTRSIHPKSYQDEEMELAVDHPSHLSKSEASPSHCTPIPGSQVRTSPSHASPVTCNLQTQTSQSPIHPVQSSPPHVQTTSSPSQTSPQPTPTSFSPPHCKPTDTSPARISVSHSLSNITSDCSGQTGPSSAIADVSIIHSPPRSSSAGQASPVHIQSTSNSPHSGSVQRQSSSLANTTYSSPAHASDACVSQPHSAAQASEMYHSPTRGPCNSLAPDTGTSSGLIAASSLDVDTAASSIIQSASILSAVHLGTGLYKPSDIIRQTSSSPAFVLPDDPSAVSPSQASLKQISQSPASPHTSANESQQSTALVSPLDQRPATPIEVSSTQTSLSQASPGHSSLTQDNTAMPSTSHTSETPASPRPSTPSQVSPPQTFTSDAPQTSSVHSSPAASPVSGHVQPEVILSPGPASPIRDEASPGPDPVCPALHIPVQPEKSLSPVPASPVLSDAGPGSPSDFSPQQNKPTDGESVACAGEYHEIEQTYFL